MNIPELDPPPDYEPRFPADRRALGIAILGFGGVARKWHLTAYRKYGLHLVGAHDISPEVVQDARRNHPEVEMYGSLEELLADPEVDIVDIATRPPGRAELVYRALEAGKHVLAQKPFAPSAGGLRDIIELARRQKVRIAVNQN